MAEVLVDIDIEDHLDEVDTSALINELKVRARRSKVSLAKLIVNELGEEELTDNELFRDFSFTQTIAVKLGLNHLASKEEIINEFAKQFK